MNLIPLPQVLLVRIGLEFGLEVGLMLNKNKPCSAMGFGIRIGENSPQTVPEEITVTHAYPANKRTVIAKCPKQSFNRCTDEKPKSVFFHHTHGGIC